MAEWITSAVTLTACGEESDRLSGVTSSKRASPEVTRKPAADGSLLKQVTTAGEDAGPQQLATPSPLCDVEAKVRTLRPKQSETRAVTWRGDGAELRFRWLRCGRRDEGVAACCEEG